MIKWITENTATLGPGLIAFAGICTAAWYAIQNIKKEKAKTGADVAIAESQREVYEQMKERLSSQEAHLTRLQEQVDKMRDEIRDRDTKIHSLELYVSDLQHILHSHGIDVPPMR